MNVSGDLPAELDAVVVGGGFAGLYAVLKLRDLGMDVRAIEAGDDIGGTWYWNRYPGARCDVPSQHYSYTWDPEFHREWEWTEKYAAQPEILSYIHAVAERHDLRKHVVLSTKVTDAQFDDSAGLWTVRTDKGDVVRARYCVMATGCLSKPKMVEVDGLESFEGEWFHTAYWPESGVDFTGKRVAVIGTGSSGIQVIPKIAEQAAHLTVFQRTANFSAPAFNGPIDPNVVAEFKANIEKVRAADKVSDFGVAVEPPTKSALEVDESERLATYQDAWEAGSVVGVLETFTDLLYDRTANATVSDFIRGKIREIVRDPAVAERLVPTHGFGTKRPCMDTNYYETYNRDNVQLVDLRETPLRAITAHGVRTSDQEREFDAIVFASGFDAFTGALFDIKITGRDGVSLKEKWVDGPMTNMGIAVAGFPNFFMITGPGSPSVLSNVIISIETDVEWLADLLSYMERSGLRVVESTETADKQWTQHVAEVASETLFNDTDSWWSGANVPGKARGFIPYAGGLVEFDAKRAAVAASGYEGFELRPA